MASNANPESFSIVTGQVLSLESTGDSSSLFCVVKTVTSEFIEPEILKRDYRTLEGKEVRWRHVPPELVVGGFLGYTREVWLEDDGHTLMSKIEILGETEEQREAQKKIKKDVEEGKPTGVSAGFIRFLDNEENTTRVFFREQSMTDDPHCKDCGVVEIMANESQDAPDKAIPSVWDNMNSVKVSVPKDYTGSVNISPKNTFEKLISRAVQYQDNNGNKKDEDEDEEAEVEETEDDDEKENGKTKEPKNEEKERSRRFRGSKNVRLESKLSELETEKAALLEENECLRNRVIELEVKEQILKSMPKRVRVLELEGIVDPEARKARLAELLAFEDKPLTQDGKSQLDLLIESLERASLQGSATRRRERPESMPVVGAPRRPRMQTKQLDDLSPDEILKMANMRTE